MYQQVMLMHLILHVCAKFGDSVSKHLKRAFPQSRGVVSSIAELVPAHLLPSTAKYPEKLKKQNAMDKHVSKTLSILCTFGVFHRMSLNETLQISKHMSTTETQMFCCLLFHPCIECFTVQLQSLTHLMERSAQLKLECKCLLTKTSVMQLAAASPA